MHRIVDVMSRPPKDQELVVAYGFDQVGLRIPSPVERPEYRIEFVQYGSSELGTNAGGIIFPTGIFEHVEYHNTPLGGRRAKVSCDRPILLGVERHVTNLLRAGGWIVMQGDLAVSLGRKNQPFISGARRTIRIDLAK